MSAARWLREWRNPSLKCDRLGHDMVERRQRVFLYPPDGILRNRCVADYAIEVTPYCRRCGRTEQTVTVERTGLTGLTLNEDRWDALKRDGRLISGVSS